jgi:uncharacterized protein YegL
MPTPLRLILSQEPVPAMSLRPVRGRSPSVAVVYATGDGELHVLDDFRPLTWSGQFFSRYKTRYEIDVSDVHRDVQLSSQPLPAYGDAHFFDTQFSLDLRVTDPAEIVRRNIQDGLTVVYPYLIDACRSISRAFDIERATEAEAAVNDRFDKPVALPQGITITGCRARLKPDPEAMRFIQGRRHEEREAARRVAEANARLHGIGVDNQAADLEQQAKLARQQRELAALGDAPLTFDRLSKIDLSRGGEAGAHIDRIHELHREQQAAIDRAEDRTTQRLSILAGENLLSPADATAVLSGPAQFQAQTPAPGYPGQAVQAGPAQSALGSSAGSWDSPLPAGVLPAGASPGTPGNPVVDLTSPPTGIIMEPVRAPEVALPVYLVVDLSAAGAGYLDAVNAGLRAVVSSLAASPGVNDVVRVSVIGYADEPGVRMPLQAIDAQAPFTPLVSDGGQTHYGGAFRQLAEVIPPDMDSLKARVTTVMRPMVFFLAGAPPTDEVPWGDARAQLMNRHVQPYPPQIIVGGIGTAPPQVVAGIASQPEYAFVAVNADPRDAARRYFTYVAQQIVACSQSILIGQATSAYQRPEGFRIANEVI